MEKFQRLVLVSGLLISVFTSPLAFADLIVPRSASERTADFFHQYGVYLGAAFILGLTLVAYMIVKKRRKK